MTATGNNGKFGERLKKISLFKRKNKNKLNNTDIQDSNKIYTNFLKVIAAIPELVYGAVTEINAEKSRTVSNISKQANINTFESNNLNDITRNNNEKDRSKLANICDNDKQNIVETCDIYVDNKNQPQKDVIKNISLDKKQKKDIIGNIGLDKKQKRDIISNINVDEIKKQQEKYDIIDNTQLKYKLDNESDNSNLLGNVNNNDRVKKLERSIINLIKKDLIKIVNEMEILQSELYILSEVNGESKVLKNCQRELDQVKSMICKIDKLKEKYDFLRDNYDFEYLLEIDNNNLVDKIIELKDLFGNNELKAVSEDYKLLDVYKYLYLKIDDLQEKTNLFQDKKKMEELKLKERDINFERLKSDVYNVDYVNRNYESFINNQNQLLKTIDENVNKISSFEQVELHLKGFNALFRNSFKYFGLLMVSPLKGIIPSIATETLITGNIIKNLYKTLEWEENKKIVYEAMDYSSIISSAINDLDATSRIVDATLDDIVHLKMKYNDIFKEYQGDFSEYRDVMHKINDMENKILGNKIKIEMMKKKALDQKHVNEKKLILVKELNEKESHN